MMETIKSLLPILLFGAVMFLIMRRGGGCCGGHGSHNDNPHNEHRQREAMDRK